MARNLEAGADGREFNLVATRAHFIPGNVVTRGCDSCKATLVDALPSLARRLETTNAPAECGAIMTPAAVESRSFLASWR